MVVLSASVCTRQGKALMSRQFVEMNRLRVEGLLAAFPKLVGLSNKQHTYVETDSVRYVYQPLENNLYLLLITTKASNIVEDLGTLRLLAKVVPDVAGGFQEHTINEHAFELIFAFDEVLTAGGYKEDATLSSIRTNLAMDSHEEKIAIALRQSREEQAKQEMQQKAKALQEQKMAAMRQTFVTGQAPTGKLGGMEGFGGGGHPGQGMGGGMFDQMQQDQGFGGQPQQEFDPYAALQKPIAPAPAAPKVLAKSGMKLGGGMGGKKNDLMAAMAAEDGLFGGGKGAAATDFGFGAPVPAPAAAPSTPLSLVLEEKISVNMNREGAVEACEVKGILNLTANTDAGATAVIAVNKAQLPSSFNYATHPKVDKKGYEGKGLLSLKGGKGFPVGRAVGILRWSYSGEDAAPIAINCWPEDEGSGMINVNIEMEMTRSDLVLQDVNILIPLGTTEAPEIGEIDGQYNHDPRQGAMIWHFDVLDASTNSGSLEFSIPGNNPDVFFPIQVQFRSETLLCPIEITGITSSASGGPIPNQTIKTFIPENYQCA
mmetsp:Transcript_102089/g.295379  ORF Transcript_102089/g.295379 Transcript_102089/m.295379 type:complete len:543 (-) Transcript_102089:81-1709(-)